jgi:uncharacterized protein (UPF0332 family)
MFHIASAAVTQFLGDSVKDSQTHKYFLGMLNQELIRNELISPLVGKYINKVQFARDMADYTSAKFTEEDARNYNSMAKEFHSELSRFLESRLTKEITLAGFEISTLTNPQKKPEQGSFSGTVKNIADSSNEISHDEPDPWDR